MKPHTVGTSPAGKYSRKTKAALSMTAEVPRMTTSQLMAVTKVPISGASEVSPIVEVLNMADYTHNTISVVPVSEPIFQASPSSVVIREFQPQETLDIQISLRNNDNVARRVKCVQPESSCFSIELSNKKQSSKVAPGMDVSYTLKFTPEERIDYFCDLVCYTEREKFIIPVRALGPRGWLDLPDEVFFDKAPVKAETLKTVLVRNVGDAPCTFHITSAAPFGATPASGSLGVEESMQVHFSFSPETTEACVGEFQVDYGTGETVYMAARGKAEELTVRLDSHALLMDPTYVTLFSQKTLKIINRSDETVAFSFKQLASPAEEQRALMRFGATEYSVQSAEEYDDSFRNDAFQLSPAQGHVWPNSEVEVTATFTPSTATEVACVAFCDVAGKANRFPVHLQGTGIGAKIVLSYNVVDIGEVFINSVSEYDVELDNQGEIEAFYELLPNDSLFGSKFSFAPSKGSLGVAQKESVKVSFSSDVLGEFNEDFEWGLQGTPQPLRMTFRGKVIGPTFHLDESLLDYKRVSVAFLNTRHFHLFNTADIPFRFHFRVPGDGALLKREFEVVPATGSILPHGKQKIQVDLIPLTTRAYDLRLVMDVEGVGEQMASVAIKAQSIVPDVTVSTTELDYGDCFLRYPYKKVLELVNHSDLPAKFELQPQDEISRCVAAYDVDYPKGTIEPFKTRAITVAFTTERLERVQLPMWFKIIGHEDDPLEIQCIAHGIGPKLTLSPMAVKWGEIDVLKPSTRVLSVTNDSLIPAEMQTLVLKRGSRFSVDRPALSLAPGEKADLALTANLDDTQPFKDDLVLVVTEGGQVKVPLAARGVGTTIWTEDYDLSKAPSIEMGHQFSSRSAKKTFVIRNRGPKPQTLTWYNGTAFEARQKADAAKKEEKKEAGPGKKKKADDEEKLIGEVFKVLVNGSTEPYLIEPDGVATVDVIGFCRKAGSVVEKLCCRSKMEKEQRVIIEMMVSADFVDPVVEFSAPELSFTYNHAPDVPLTASTQQLTVKSTCPLPLECVIKASGMPFQVDPGDINLAPFGTATLEVAFDPGYKGKKESEEVRHTVSVQFNMGPSVEPKNEKAPHGFHPKKGVVDLLGSINFPNLKLDKSDLKFGAVLNDTTRRVKVRCTNTSTIEAAFAWSFVISDPSEKKRPGSSGTSIQSGRLDPPQPINAVFDILPTRSFLKPGEGEDIEFVFYGHANHKYRALAVCEVQGGPEYEVKLEGEASSIQYKFDRTSLDFGNALYDKFAVEEVTLHNTGKVKYDFKVRCDDVPRPSVIKAVPPTGVAMPGDKVKIQIHFLPGMPSYIQTLFTVDVAHFDPQVIQVTGKGTFPHISVNLPRLDPKNFARLLVEAQEVLGLVSGSGGMDTARTEGMPSATTRTMGTEADRGMSGGDSVYGGGGGRRLQTGQRPPTMSLDVFVQSNPYVRQLQAEGDCLGMREYILDNVREFEEEQERRRRRVIFDEDAEREAMQRGSQPMLEDSPSKSPTDGPAAPPGPAGELSQTPSLPLVDMKKFVLAEYTLDFGNVVKGQQLQKEFRVQNVGLSQVSFEFPKPLKAAMAAAGFIVEPDRVQRLPGSPDFETADFSVIFNSNRPGVNLGPIDLLLPLQTRSGPQVYVFLKANVTIPDVDVSTEQLRFGTVLVGHMRSISVQISNPKEIPAAWSFGQAMASEAGASKATNDFTVLPAKGLLNPGESCNVQVVFHPRTSKNYNVKVPLKVAQNSGKRHLKISAASDAFKIRFDPPTLDMAPILPFVQETEQRVTMFNDTDTRIEVYSVDFDKRYLEEEEMLRRVDVIYQPSILGYQDIALLPLRQPDQPLQEEVLRAWEPIAAADKKREEEEAAEAERAAAAAEEGGEAPPAEGEGEAAEGEEEKEEEKDGVAGGEAAVDGAVGLLQPLEPDVPTFNAVVHAHPLAWGGRMTKALARKFVVGVVNVQAVVDELLKEAGIQPFMEEVPADEEDEPSTFQAVPNKWQLDPEALPVDVAKELQELFFPPPPPKEEGEEGEEGGEAPPEEGEGDDEGEAAPPEARTAEVEEGWLTLQLLEKAVRRRCARLDCVRGVVFDGLACSYMPDQAQVAKVLSACMSAKTLHLVHVNHEQSPPPPEPEEGEGEPAAGAEAVEEADGGAGETEGEAGGEEADKEGGDESGWVSAEEGESEGEGGGMGMDGVYVAEGAEAAPSVEEEPEPELDGEALEAALEAYNESLQAIIDVFEPPPPEEGEEAAPADPAEEEGERPRTPPPPTTLVVVRTTRVDRQSLDEVCLEACARLPKVRPLPGEGRRLEIPPPAVRELVARPLRRSARAPVRNFYILTPKPVVPEKGEEGAEGGGGEGEEGEEGGGEKEIQYELVEATRWVVEARGSVELVVRMRAEDTGRCECVLGFEVQGGGMLMRGREFGLPCRGMCAYPQMSQNPHGIYYKRIKAPPPGMIVSKQFVVSRNVFEFGPLLVGKDKEDYKEKYPENRERFRITNNGLFPMHVDLCFKDDVEGNVFVVEPAGLDLPVDETQDVTVYAFTEEEGEFKDKLICNVADNPEPVEINVSCVGSVPNIVTDIEPILDEEGEPQEGLKIEFQRLLVGRKDVRNVTIKNDSLLAASWTLEGIDEDCNQEGKEFTIHPVAGTLGPGKTEDIAIGFAALEKNEFDKTIKLQWVDVDGLLPEPKALEVQLTAEAYEIDFTFDFPSGEGLDFGAVKVAEGGEQTFTITNNGKYQVGYKFQFNRPKKSLAAKYFKIECADEGEYEGQSAGVLEPDGASAQICVLFDSKPFPGQEEVDLRDNMELRCVVSELLTGEEIISTPIKINVRSVFSKYRVLPQKGISFGALTYDQSKSRTFDIVNQGEFEFTFEMACITHSVSTGVARSRPGTAAARRASQEGMDADISADGSLKFGNFTVSPATGTVAPNGEKQTITVEFGAEGEQQFFEVLGIQISERDPAVDKNGLPYELSSESCVPGILNTDFLQIFEEAAVWRKPSEDPTELIRNTFIEEERCFHFGPRMVDQRQEVRVKIINPTKVSVVVNLKLTAKGDQSEGVFEILEPQLQLPMHEHRYATLWFKPKGLSTYNAVFEALVDNGTNEATNKLVFDVKGEGTLPRVTITQPSLRNANGQAKVQFNRLLVGKVQTVPFSIKNEGIMPATVRFGQRIGEWPAPENQKDWKEGPRCFQFDGRGAELLMQPKEEKHYSVTFRPKSVGEDGTAAFAGALEMIVHSNEFERNLIELQGTAFTQDVSFDNMPDNAEDLLNFGSMPVGVSKTMSFTISNNSDNIYRFAWEPEDANLISFTPSAGHLQPHDSKEIIASVSPKEKVSVDVKEVPLTLTQIRYPGEAHDWDDGMKEVEWVTDDHNVTGENTVNVTGELDTSFESTATGAQTRRGRKSKPRKVTKIKPEPAFEVMLDGEPPEEGAEDERKAKEDSVVLKVSVNSDYLSYAFVQKNNDGEDEDGEPPADLQFAETMMYRTREHQVRFKNTSQARMEASWSIVTEGDDEDTDPEAPFLVQPERCELEPGQVCDVTIRFAPTEVDTYTRKVVANIKNLTTRVPKPINVLEEGDEDKEEGGGEDENAPPAPQLQPEIVLRGKSARPFCHFELVESDWLTGGRRPPNLTTPGGAAVDPSSHCVEFESLGTQVRNTKRFYVMNPTNMSYKYRWECEDGTGAAVAHLASAFKCVHKEGFVLSGKKAEMVFEYTPGSDELLESFWRFEIPEHNLTVPFVLVGHVKEPRVYFDRTYCNFSSLLLNHKAVQTVKLVNKEHIPFAFAFNGRTYGAEEVPPVVKITPSQGTVGPESEMDFQVQFMPKQEKAYNFNAVCNVKKKATRLALNIKGEGFDTHATVTMEDERGGYQIGPMDVTAVDFGDVHVNETRVRTVTVVNTGKYPIELEWREQKNRLLTIKPDKCSVPKGEKVDILLAFHPLTEASLQDHKCSMQVINGPRFNFSVSGSGRKPMLAFSFTRMDFGPCFLYKQGARATQAVLRLTNEDTHDVSYDVVFDNKPYLELDASPTNLSPGQSEEIAVTFMPRELRDYHEVIGFNINGLYTVNFEVTGSGHECDISLANPNQFNFSLGAVPVGTVVERRIRVRNNSPVFASCSLADSGLRLEGFDIQLRPLSFDLKPRETTDLELTFNPNNRILPFSEDLKIDVAGTNRTLMVLSGSAVGVELKLESDMLFFGAVVMGTRTVRRLQLENVGDIGTKWRWAPGAFAPDFSVEPMEGFLNPNDETTIEFSFHPRNVSDDCRRDNVPLFIEGADSLNVTLTGICVSQEPQEGSIDFEGPVRQTDTKPLPAIKNPTDSPWLLHPVIDNDFWSGPDVLEVPPGEEVACELAFRPLAMTATPEEVEAEDAEDAAAEAEKEAGEEDGKKRSVSELSQHKRKQRRPRAHSGSVFVPLPDGSAVMYKLEGTAGPPLAEAEAVSRSVQCKATHTEALSVKNWLGRPQRFTVQIDPPPEGTTTLRGASYIDVPAHAERSYALKFHTYVEGTTQAKVTLTNEETREYIFFDVEFTASESPVLSTYDLSTVVRQSKDLEIAVSNPLGEPVIIKGTCDNPDVVLQEEYELRALGETQCKIVFRPLLPCASVPAQVKFTSAELGDFVYQLNLSATGAGADRSMQFKAPLGGLETQTFRFRHFLQDRATYSCETGHPGVFTVSDSVAGPPSTSPDGVEVEVEVTFEPDFIGEVHSKLRVKSDEGGEYVCILNGHGLAPKPQGPIDVSGKAEIAFKNPFTTPMSFNLAVDNEAFVVPDNVSDVASRAEVKLQVAYKAPASGQHVPGKLTVDCPGYPPWIYYLKGSG